MTCGSRRQHAMLNLAVLQQNVTETVGTPAWPAGLSLQTPRPERSLFQEVFGGRAKGTCVNVCVCVAVGARKASMSPHGAQTNEAVGDEVPLVGSVQSELTCPDG